jgi:hypothetical protein
MSSCVKITIQVPILTNDELSKHLTDIYEAIQEKADRKGLRFQPTDTCDQMTYLHGYEDKIKVHHRPPNETWLEELEVPKADRSFDRESPTNWINVIEQYLEENFNLYNIHEDWWY